MASLRNIAGSLTADPTPPRTRGPEDQLLAHRGLSSSGNDGLISCRRCAAGESQQRGWSGAPHGSGLPGHQTESPCPAQARAASGRPGRRGSRPRYRRAGARAWRRIPRCGSQQPDACREGCAVQAEDACARRFQGAPGRPVVMAAQQQVGRVGPARHGRHDDDDRRPGGAAACPASQPERTPVDELAWPRPPGPGCLARAGGVHTQEPRTHN